MSDTETTHEESTVSSGGDSGTKTETHTEKTETVETSSSETGDSH